MEPDSLPDALKEALKEALKDALTPASSDAAVLSRLDKLVEILPESDGLRHLSRRYLEIAQALEGALATGGFAEADFLRRLEVNFANLYFEALQRLLFPSEKRPLGPAWGSVFAARHAGITPGRFASAGLHAHLNLDLCLAVVRTCEERALTPEKGSPQHRDFKRLGEVWHDHLRIGSADPDDNVATWSCLEARSLAWDNAEVLWHLRSSAELTADYLSLLERNVVNASRTLLAKNAAS